MPEEPLFRAADPDRRSSRISACTRAPPRVAPAPLECAAPESVIASQNANAAWFCNGSSRLSTTPQTAPVSLRTPGRTPSCHPHRCRCTHAVTDCAFPAGDFAPVAFELQREEPRRLED